jgi:nucleotide-binding universal stress UspA family protein
MGNTVTAKGPKRPTGEQLCRYLQLNEVPAKPLIVGLDGRLTGEVILAYANALGCDLLIKGAYTQSRLQMSLAALPATS